jgi:hypothetical protein
VSVVGTGTELDVWTARDANVVASTGILLTAHAGAARAVRLAVGTSAELDSWTAGNADVETRAGILLAVTSGGSGVMGLGTAENRKTVLVASVSVVFFDNSESNGVHGVRNLPDGEKTARRRGRWREQGTERPRG